MGIVVKDNSVTAADVREREVDRALDAAAQLLQVLVSAVLVDVAPVVRAGHPDLLGEQLTRAALALHDVRVAVEDAEQLVERAEVA